MESPVTRVPVWALTSLRIVRKMQVASGQAGIAGGTAWWPEGHFMLHRASPLIEGTPLIIEILPDDKCCLSQGLSLPESRNPSQVRSMG